MTDNNANSRQARLTGAEREFIERVAKQKPEKPDYWSSCSQCEHNISDAEDLVEARADAAATAPFQQRVQPWMLECFGAEIAADGMERNHRFLEESLELVQACGCTRSEAHQLVDYVFSRPVGQKDQKVGGVMVTLAALCLAQSLDMHAAGDTELARVWTKVEQIRAKQAAKPKHSPLPEAAPASASAPQLVTWHPIETAPKDGTVVLVILPESDIPCAARFDAGCNDWRHCWDNYRLRNLDAPTHWMPLPPALSAQLAANTAAIAADRAGNGDRAQVIARAVAAHNRAWPEQLTSGVMFYEGERITRAEFLAEGKA